MLGCLLLSLFWQELSLGFTVTDCCLYSELIISLAFALMFVAVVERAVRRKNEPSARIAVVQVIEYYY